MINKDLLSPKQKNRLRRLKKRMCKLILLYLLVDLFLAAVFWNGYRVNTPLAEQQLRTVSGTVEYVRLYETRHGPDSLFVTIDGQRYKLFWRWGYDRLKTYTEYLSATRPYVTVTVLERQPVAMLIGGYRDIVAISDEQHSFDSSEKENSRKIQNRRVSMILGIVVAVHVLPFEALYFHFSYSDDYRQLKRIANNRAEKISPK